MMIKSGTQSSLNAEGISLIPIHTDRGGFRKSINTIAGFSVEILGTHYLPITGDNFGENLSYSFIFIIIHFITIDYTYHS
jgi:hypothetical protein